MGKTPIPITKQLTEGESVMRLLDFFFGSGADRDVRVRNQTLPLRNYVNDDKEVITVDPHEPLSDPSGRPPIIFENGLM